MGKMLLLDTKTKREMTIRWPNNGVKSVRATEKYIELRRGIQVNAELQHTPAETEGADAD